MAQLLELENKTIRVNARGEWFHGDEALHPRVAELFRRHIVVDTDGTYILHLQHQRAPLVVEDTPFFVRQVSIEKSGTVIDHIDLQVSDGAVEPLDPATLRQGHDNVLYCTIRRSGRAVRCRFTQQLYHTLMLEAETTENGHVLTVGGQRWSIGKVEESP